MNTIFDEVYTLSLQNSRAMSELQNTDADMHDEAKRLTDVMFIRPSDNEATIVRSNLNSISEFIPS